jgi:RNA polymerase sigma-70 factor (ECF subfamily)
MSQALRLTHERSAAEDLVQDTMLKAALNHDKFEAGSNLGAWLFTILRNNFLSGKRKHRHERELDPELQDTIPDENAGISFEDSDATDYDFEVVMHAIASLSDKMSEPLILCHYAECNYDEIVAELGVTLGTVKSRISRAIEQVVSKVSTGKIETYDIESWLTQKILSAHARGYIKLAKACESMFTTYTTVRRRVDTAGNTSEVDRKPDVSTKEIDAGIEDLFGDF